jgi:hypothetical protein
MEAANYIASWMTIEDDDLAAEEVGATRGTSVCDQLQ